MRVLTEFTRDLTDTQLPNVGPVILQEMYRIFQNENVRIYTIPKKCFNLPEMKNI